MLLWMLVNICSFHSLGAITWIQTSSHLPSGPKLYESLSNPGLPGRVGDTLAQSPRVIPASRARDLLHSLQVLVHLIVREEGPPLLDAALPLKEHNAPASILRWAGKKIIGAIAQMFAQPPP